MSKHVLVVGGGVIGLCSAYYAALQGHHVTVVDRNAEVRDGCSFGNAGMVVPSHFVPLAAPGMVAMGLKWMWNPESPFYIKPRLDWELFRWGWRFWKASTQARVDKASPLLRDLSFASRASFEELASLANLDFQFRQHGLLMLCKTQHALDEEAEFAARANRLGIPAEVLDAKQTALQDPNVTMNVAGSVYFPRDCHLSPNRFMMGILSQCRSMGVQFRWQSEIRDWVCESQRIVCVKTAADEFNADEIVLCGGAWTDPLAKQIGLKLPMQAGKGYSVTLKHPRQLPRICSIFTEARVAVTPMGDSLRFGGTMEIAGLNERINPRRVQGIIKSVPEYYPEFKTEDFHGIEPWQGLRPCSPDGLPYIGRTAKYKNVVVATGHAMMGISLGPVTGRLIADILTDIPPRIPLDLLSPDRYS